MGCKDIKYGCSTTSLTNHHRFLFPVRIGTPQQLLHLIFDTGSGDFWVWSWLMPDSLKYYRNFYNGSNSSTASRWEGQSFGVAYGAGSLHGLVWQDTVWVDNIGVGGNPIECAQVSPIRPLDERSPMLRELSCIDLREIQ